MSSILLVAHAPLASALLAVARHAYPECGAQLRAVDVPASASQDAASALVVAALLELPDPEVLVLVDAFGATPSTAALAVVNGVQGRVVTGVNVPMVWRALCYRELSLGELVTRAVDGGRQGIMQVASPRRQNQPNRPISNDSEPHSDQ